MQPGFTMWAQKSEQAYSVRRDLVGPWRGDGIELTEKRDKEMPAGGNGIIINRKNIQSFSQKH